LARLIVLDASVVIAALSGADAHHSAASAAIASTSDDELVLAATTRAEILIGPMRAGGSARAAAGDFVDGCVTVPITASLADNAARLRAGHRALSLPDAIALVVAEAIDADVVWTLDQRWSTVDARVVVL
jgi:predicted nucleic acid-binding protein